MKPKGSPVRPSTSRPSPRRTPKTKLLASWLWGLSLFWIQFVIWANKVLISFSTFIFNCIQISGAHQVNFDMLIPWSEIEMWFSFQNSCLKQYWRNERRVQKTFRKSPKTKATPLTILSPFIFILTFSFCFWRKYHNEVANGRKWIEVQNLFLNYGNSACPQSFNSFSFEFHSWGRDSLGDENSEIEIAFEV